MIDPIKRHLAWQAMRAAGAAGFRVSEVCEKAEENYKTVQRYITQLAKEKYVLRLTDLRGVHGESRYFLSRDTGLLAPIFHNGFYDPNLAGEIRDSRQRLWVALRISQKACSIQELASLSKTSTGNVRRYMLILELSGYVRRQDKKFRLVQNTGIAAPIPFEGGVYDPNSGTKKMRS